MRNDSLVVIVEPPQADLVGFAKADSQTVVAC